MKHIKKFFNDIFSSGIKRVTFIMYFAVPILVNLFIESLSRRSLLKCFQSIIGSPLVFLINVMIIGMTLSVTLLLRKRIFGMAVISAVWVIFGIANFVITSYRVTPFSASDLKLIDSAFTIIDKYMNLFSIVFIAVLLVAVVFGIVILWLKCPAYAEKISYLKNLLFIFVISAVVLGSVNIFISTGVLSLKFSNLTEAYYDYGFVYGFSNSLVNTGVKKPDNYSSESIVKIVEKISRTKTVDSDKKQTPNIIFLQLESFFDLNNVKNLELSSDPTPYFNSLKKQYPSGRLSVNNVGYGTANTEFEVLTGMNLDDFGAGEFPYKTVLKNMTCESLSYILRENNYATHAMHNNTATFYSRHEIFSQLGFDDYIAKEAMNISEYTYLEWAKDKVLTDEIKKVLDSTAGMDFIYAISVQGHGSYPEKKVIEDPVITVGGIDEERQYAFEYYANQIYEMDLFVKALIESLEERDEETVLIMYGDHLPSLGLTEEDLVNESLYQTEYIMWNNFGLKTENEDVETFQLGSKLLMALNIDTGYINKFHQIYRGKEDYLASLHTLEYDMLYGRQYVFDGENPYVATDIRYVLDNIVIDDVIAYVDTDSESDSDEIIIKGTYFTGDCIVYVNDDMYDTEFIDENTLKIVYSELDNLDSFVIKMQAGDTVLAVSSEYLYIEKAGESDSSVSAD